MPEATSDLVIRGRRPMRDRALVMAIVNRTPDSFYDQGATFSDEPAKAAIDRAVAEGADMIDIGGVAASPGDDVDGDEVERGRVAAAAANAARDPRGFLRLGIVVVMSPSTCVIFSPLTCCARSHQCEPMSANAREGPPRSESTRQLSSSGDSSQSCR